MTDSVFDAIDRIAISRENDRGIKDLYASVREISVSSMCLTAAKYLEGVRRVFVVTGFPVVLDDGRVVGETDGPLGAARLAYGLSLMGMDCCVVTDERYCRPVMELLNALEINAMVAVVRKERKTVKNLKDLLDRYRPEAVVAIEVPGRGQDDRYRSMNGVDITQHTTPLDRLIDLARERGMKTIGIGDGGNEAGMGWIMDAVKRVVKNGASIASKVKTDQLIVASTSNWGAYGLLTALGKLKNKPLLCNGGSEERLFNVAFSSGLVDGRLRQPARSVDGFSSEESADVVRELIELIHYDELACNDE